MTPAADANFEYLLKEVYNGSPALFAAGTPLDVHRLRSYILELVQDAHPGERHRSCLRWEIHGAVFAARLDLKDGRRADGGSVPALEFHGCEFQQGFCADGAHLDRLVFKQCAFTSANQQQNGISLRNCRISTELQLEGLRPHDREGPLPEGRSAFQQHLRGMLWVDAFATSIGTNVIVRHSLFRAPAEQSDLTVPEARYALDFSTAGIRCDLRLQPSVTLEGGLKLRDARIEGSFFGQGLTVTDGEDETTRSVISAAKGEPRSGISAQSVAIHGNILFSVDKSRMEEPIEGLIDPVRFWCVGGIGMYGLRLGGTLDMSGAYVGGTKFARVELYSSQIDGDLLALPVILPAVQNRADIFPRLILEIGPPKEQKGAYLLLANSRVRGNCTLHAMASSLFASGASIDGNLALSGNFQRCIADGIQVGRDTTLNFEQSDLTTNLDELEQCNLGGALLRGKLDMVEISCHVRSLSLRDAEIGHALVIAPLYTRFGRVRRSKLLCYPDFTLNEIEINKDAEAGTKESVATFITSKNHKPILLDGRSRWIYQLNKDLGLLLTSEEMAQDYLRLFCAHVWGELGSFTLVEKPSKLPKIFQGAIDLHSVRLSKGREHDPGKAYHFDAFVRYAHRLYYATFTIDAITGAVDMLADEPFRKDDKYILYEWDELPKFRSPFRLESDWDDAEFNPTLASVEEGEVARTSFQKEAPNWSEVLTRYRFSDAEIDLRDARCGMLNDNSGRAWSGAALRLDEFKYRETFLPNSVQGGMVDEEVKYRKKMLHGGKDFRAQPYAHLAKVLRERGDDDAARKIEVESIRLGARDRARREAGAKFLFACWWVPYGFFFRYGLGIGRAFLTLIGFLAIGWLAVSMLSQNGFLNASVSTVASTAILERSSANADPTVSAVISAPSGNYIKAIPCGNTIAPVLYAAELMTPILNFRQANRCEIRDTEPGDEKKVLTLWGHPICRFHWMVAPLHWMVHPPYWEYLKGLYIVLGSLVTSLALLTFSGIARRWEH